jgi:EpsI family protein
MNASAAIDTGRAKGLPAGSDLVHLLMAGLLMLACLGLSVWIKPTKLWSEKVGEPDLENAVPKAFGDWVLSPHGVATMVNPQQEDALREVYSSTLARVYIHKPTGRQVMLSLAYGSSQSRDTQVHLPEVCYGANGFRIMRLQPDDIRIGDLTLPAMRMDAVTDMRQEFVTYWVRVGDQLARGALQRNLIRMRFAVNGYIADGLLVRVSEVTRRSAVDSYRLQDEFMANLMAEIARTGNLERFVGRFGTAAPKLPS